MRNQSFTQKIAAQLTSQPATPAKDSQSAQLTMGTSVQHEPHEHHDGCEHTGHASAAPSMPKGINRRHTRQLEAVQRKVVKVAGTINKKRHQKAQKKALKAANHIVTNTTPYTDPEAVARAEELLGK